MNQNKLLPNKYKWNGFVISLIALCFFIFINVYHKKNPVPHFGLIREISKSFFILGLVFVMFSKEKIENERILMYRLNAFSFSFMVVIFSFIMQPLIPINQNISFFQIVFQMCFLYLFWYYLLKIDLFKIFITKNKEQS